MSWLGRVDRVLALITWAVAAILALMLFIGPQIVAEDDPEARAQDPSPTYGSEEGADETTEEGKALFKENCGSCHTLAAAGTTGTIGPSLDGAGVSADDAATIVTDGRGSMPSFGGQLDEAQIQAVAEFVASASAP
ncbi:MAG: c-type cytochrome [Solirubrobacterales bacterium]